MCHRVMPKDGINTATAIMPAINPSILYRKTGTTTYTYRITTVSTITPMDSTMTQVDFLLKAIKTDATITTIMAVAMTNTEASKIKGSMTEKNTIGAIGRIEIGGIGLCYRVIIEEGRDKNPTRIVRGYDK